MNSPDAEIDVSVILPAFGEFPREPLPLCVEGFARQKRARVEILVAAVEGEALPLREMDDLPVRVVRVPRRDSSMHGYYLPGALRNAAARLARGRFLYNSDLDVIPHSVTFLRDAISFANSRAAEHVCHPPMRRIPQDDVAPFRRMAARDSLPVALERLSLDRPFIATLLPGSHRTIVFRNDQAAGTMVRASEEFDSVVLDGEESRGDERILVYLETDFVRYRSREEHRGWEPSFSTQDIHCGGTLVARRAFEHIGGFSTEFAGWGCHDADLQMKLIATCPSTRFPKTHRFLVLHLDHERGYFDPARWRENRRLLEQRRADLPKVIRRDRSGYEGWGGLM